VTLAIADVLAAWVAAARQLNSKNKQIFFIQVVFVVFKKGFVNSIYYILFN